jgi:hypothetical protein
MACIAPPLYGYSIDSIPPDRVLFLPHTILIFTAACWGCIMGMGFRQDQANIQQHIPLLVLGLILVLLVLGPMASISKVIARIPDYRLFAVQNDERDQTIRTLAASGVQDVQVKPLDVDMAYMGGLDIITLNPNHWFNVCVADYYGVKTISANSE